MIQEAVKKKIVEDFWTAKLGPGNFSYRKVELLDSNGTKEVSRKVSNQALRDLNAKFRGNDEGKFVVLISAFSMILHRGFDISSLLISVPTVIYDGPLQSEIDATMLFRSSHDNEKTLKDYTASLYDEIKKSQQYESIELDVLKNYKTRDGYETGLDFGFNYSEIPNSCQSYKDSISLVCEIEEFAEDQLSFSINYDSGIYESYVVEQLADDFIQFLNSWSNNWKSVLDKIKIDEIVSEDQPNIEETKLGLLHLWNDAVKSYPNKVAITFDKTEYTYQQLDEKSDRLSDYLISQSNVGNETLVGIYLNDSENCLLAIISILKAGGAFIPLSPKQPKQHNEYIIKDTNVSVILTESEYMFDFDFYSGDIFAFDIQMDGLPEVTEKREVVRYSDSLCYVIYTSGTTGQPKGVIIEDKSVVDYTLWLQENFHIDADDSSILISSYIFDLGYTSIWGTLLLGGTLHQLSKDISLDPDYYINEIINRKVSFIKTTPSLFAVLSKNSAFPKLKDIFKKVFLGGEFLSAKDALQYQKILPDTVIINHYGPTEATVGVIANIVDNDLESMQSETALIGRVKKNSFAHVVDKSGSRKKNGFPGEILLGGSGIARGYLNKPELTHQKFTPDPLNGQDKTYRTGDVGRQLQNGKFVFEGRKDRQLKRRGFRIELEGIEAILKTHPKVKNAILWCDESNANYLVAFVHTEANISSSALNNHMSNALPNYMLPDHYVLTATMPLLKNGKVDLKKLLTEHKGKIRPKTEYLAPSNEVEIFIAKILESVLEIENVGLNDNFFDLGANSITLIEVNTLVNGTYPSIHIVDLFNYPTVAKLAKLIATEDNDESIIIDSELAPFPPSFLAQSEDSSQEEHSDLKVYIKDEPFAGLQKTTSSLNVGYYDVLIALYSYVIYEISEQEIIPLFVYSEDKNVIQQLEIDFSKFDTPSDLIQHIKKIRADVDNNLSFSAPRSMHVKYTNDDKSLITPFIYKSSELSGQKYNSEIFNAVIKIEDEEADKIGLTLSYDHTTLKKDKMTELISMLSTLVNNLNNQ